MRKWSIGILAGIWLFGVYFLENASVMVHPFFETTTFAATQENTIDNRRRGAAIPQSAEVFDGKYFLERNTGVREGKKGGTALQDYTGKRTKQEVGENMLRSTIMSILNFLKRLLIPILVLLITWSGITLFLHRGSEDSLKNNKNQILAMVVGFGIILLAVSLIEKVFFGRHGEILVRGDSSGFAVAGYKEILGIVTYIETFVVVVAVAFLIFTVFRLVFAGEEEGELTNLKKQVMYSGMGIIIIVIIRNVVAFFTVSGRFQTINPGGFHMLYATLLRWANVLLGIIGVVAVVSLIWGGARLMTSYGDDAAMEEAKKIIKFSIFGLVLAFSAYTIVRYVILPGK